MTRINIDLNPSLLTDQHLMAEYRELPMVSASLKRSLKNKTLEEIIKKIPKDFTLNKGHVYFFYNKLKFLDNRYIILQEELINRGFNLDDNRTSGIDNTQEILYNDWRSKNGDVEIIKERILTRILQKPTWYKFYGAPINKEFIERFKCYENKL